MRFFVLIILPLVTSAAVPDQIFTCGVNLSFSVWMAVLVFEFFKVGWPSW